MSSPGIVFSANPVMDVAIWLRREDLPEGSAYTARFVSWEEIEDLLASEPHATLEGVIRRFEEAKPLRHVYGRSHRLFKDLENLFLKVEPDGFWENPRTGAQFHDAEGFEPILDAHRPRPARA